MARIFNLKIGTAAASATYANEPAGYTLLSARPFGTAEDSNWTSDITVVTDATAPVSPSDVGQWHYPLGETGTVYGGGSWIMTGGVHRVYLGFWMKLSDPWQEHVTTHTSPKLVYVTDNDTGGGGDPFFLTRGIDSQIDGWIQHPDPIPGRSLGQNVGTKLAEPGSWYQVELVLVMNSAQSTDVNGDGTSDGAFHLWVDGTKVSEYTDVWFSAATVPEWDAVNFNALFGGGGDTALLIDQYLWIDDVRLSTSAT